MSFQTFEVIPLSGADVQICRNPYLGFTSTLELFERIRQETPWEQKSVRIMGNYIPQPRLVAWLGDAPYTYSGLRLTPKPWSDAVNTVRMYVQQLLGMQFNSCLLNLYRDGRDSIGMHSDNEPELGPNPVIASVSLGQERIFVLKPKIQGGMTHRIALTDGSLLVMQGDTQRNWEHGISKTTRPVGERINLTFRNIS